MKINDTKDEVNVHRFGSMTLLQIMAVLAALGLISTWILRSFFAS